MNFGSKLRLMIEEVNKIGEEIKRVEQTNIDEFRNDVMTKDSFEAMQNSRFRAVEEWRVFAKQIEQTAPKSASDLESSLNSIERTLQSINKHYTTRKFLNSKKWNLYKHYVRKYLKEHDEMYLAVTISQQVMIETLQKIYNDYEKYSE